MASGHRDLTTHSVGGLHERSHPQDPYCHRGDPRRGRVRQFHHDLERELSWQPADGGRGVRCVLPDRSLAAAQRAGHRGRDIRWSAVPVRGGSCPWLYPAQRLGLDHPDRFRPGVAGRPDRGHHGPGRSAPPPGPRPARSALLAGEPHVVHHERMDSPLPAPGRGRVTAAAASAAVVLALTGSAVAVAYDRAGSEVFADTLCIGVVLAVIAVVGAVVVLAVPGNRTGWLLLAAAALMGVGEAFTQAGIYGVRTSPGSVPAAGYLAAIGPALQAAGLLIAVVCVPIVFPDGHLPGRR